MLFWLCHNGNVLWWTGSYECKFLLTFFNIMQKIKAFLSVMLLTFTFVTYGQNITVKGVVTDASNGETIPAASVIVKGTSNGVITDLDGKYSISVPANAILVFSSVGYQSAEISISGKDVVNCALAVSAEFLDEVVVTAMGIFQGEESSRICRSGCQVRRIGPGCSNQPQRSHSR